MSLLILLAVLLAGLAAAALMRQGRERGVRDGAPHDGALVVLRERYPRGEIDRETYERMREDLRG